jgi:hypothetical protein
MRAGDSGLLKFLSMLWPRPEQVEKKPFSHNLAAIRTVISGAYASRFVTIPRTIRRKTDIETGLPVANPPRAALNNRPPDCMLKNSAECLFLRRNACYTRIRFGKAKHREKMLHCHAIIALSLVRIGRFG